MAALVRFTRKKKMTKKSEDTLNIHQRIHAIMKDLSYIKKEGKNSFQKYSFTKHDDVTRSVREQFVNHGVVAVPRLTGHTKESHQQKDGIAILTVVDIEVDFVNMDDPKDFFTVPGFGYGIDKNDLGPGKALSYAVKNVYLKTFALETGEKDNEETADDSNIPKTQEMSPAKKKYNEIGKALEAAQTSDECNSIWNSNIQHISTFPEDAQAVLQNLRVRFNDQFPGDL